MSVECQLGIIILLLTVSTNHGRSRFTSHSTQCFHKSSQCSKWNEWVVFPQIMAVFPYKEDCSVVSKCVISDDGIISNISLPVSSMGVLFRSFLILISILPRMPIDFHLV